MSHAINNFKDLQTLVSLISADGKGPLLSYLSSLFDVFTKNKISVNNFLNLKKFPDFAPTCFLAYKFPDVFQPSKSFPAAHMSSTEISHNRIGK